MEYPQLVSCFQFPMSFFQKTWRNTEKEKKSQTPQCEAPKIAKLVYNSNNYGLWYAKNYGIHGAYKPIYNWGAPHCIISA